MSEPTFEVGEIIHIGCMCKTARKCECGFSIQYSECSAPAFLKCPSCNRQYPKWDYEKLELGHVKRGPG